MGGDEINDAGRQVRFERWEKFGLDRVKADLLNGGHQLIGGPPAVQDLAWEWVRMKEAEAPHEVLTLKPGIWGMSIDLKELARAIRRYFASGAPTWAVASAVAFFTSALTAAAMWWALKLPSPPIPLPGDIPQGAVVAFAVDRGCPDGWKPFKPATARFIIGAGADFLPEYAKDVRGEQLSPRGYLDAKGEQAHLLTKGELPKEPVFFAAFASQEFVMVNKGGTLGDRFVGANPLGGPPLGTGSAGTFVRRITEPMGDGVAHSVIPPYVALYYCQKDAK